MEPDTVGNIDPSIDAVVATPLGSMSLALIYPGVLCTLGY
jgi:hypothetical protein